jgi:hypothetical protein
MFRDRDLFLLGVGALLSALCLLLPVAFAGKLVAGVLTLVGFMALALLRLGPDRVPLEEWLLRRLRFWLSPRRFVYRRPDWKANFARKPSWRARTSESAKGEAHPGSRPRWAPQIGFRLLDKFTKALSESESTGRLQSPIYPLVTVFLAVLGAYFVTWLAQGGAEEIAAVFR